MSARAPRRGGRRLVTSLVTGVVLVGALAALGVALGSPAAPAALEVVDRPAPALAGRTVDGGRLDLSTMRGSVVLVTVWASWCPPCREELPLLGRTRDRFSDRGLVLVGVLTRDRPEGARALLDQLGVEPFPSVEDPTGAVAVAWGATGVPETFLVDRAGRVVARSVGPLTDDWVARHVEPALGAP